MSSDKDEMQLSQDSVTLPWDTITPEVEVARGPYPTIECGGDDSDCEPELAAPASGGAFTIPLISLGIGLIAMCLLIPASDENRRLAYERDRLTADLEQLHKQVATNDAFLKRVADDPSLAERLARRQLKMVPEGTAVLDLKTAPQARTDMSPFLLVTVPPPAPVAPFKPVGGFLADLCRHPKTQLYLIGASLLMIAAGLVLSRSTSALADAMPQVAANSELPITSASRPARLAA
jgi:hypothetical protein